VNSRILLAVTVIFVVTVIPSFNLAFAATNNGNTSIQAANSSINQAFQNVLAAEKDGANVTRLLTNLNNAGELLTKAENAYHMGDLNSTSSNANNALLIATEVNTAALTLKNTSAIQSQNNFRYTIIFSASAASIYVVILFIVWRRFRQGYNKKLLSLKPEVADDGV